MARVFNFSAGPAMLPEAVLERAQKEMLDFDNTGMSVMEMSHRGKDFVAIAEKAEADLRKFCLLYTSPSPRDRQKSRMPSSA